MDKDTESWMAQEMSVRSHESSPFWVSINISKHRDTLGKELYHSDHHCCSHIKKRLKSVVVVVVVVVVISGGGGGGGEKGGGGEGGGGGGGIVIVLENSFLCFLGS